MDLKPLEIQIAELDRKIESTAEHLKMLKRARRKAQATLDILNEFPA